MLKIYLDHHEKFNALELRPLTNWGHGVFTSFKAREGKILFASEHFERLQKQFAFLFEEDAKEKLLADFRFIQEKIQSGRVRICLFKESERIRSLIEVTPYFRVESLKVKSLQVNTYQNPKLKLPQYAYAFSLKEKVQKLGFDDYLAIDEGDFVKELSTSNLVMLKNNILTFSNHPDVFQGIMAKKLQTYADSLSYKVQSRSIVHEELFLADALFAVNSVQNFVFIEKLDDKTFTKDERMSELEEKIRKKCDQDYGKK